MLVTASESIVEPIMQAIREQLDRLPRKEITEKSLSHSRLIVLKDKQEVIDFTNLYAPEHLIIQTTDYADIAGQVENAGSVFTGILYAGKRWRLRFRYEPYVADQRICKSLQWREPGQLHQEDHVPGDHGRRHPAVGRDDPDNGGQRAAGCAQECSNNQIEHIMKDLKDLVRPNVWNMKPYSSARR